MLRCMSPDVAPNGPYSVRLTTSALEGKADLADTAADFRK